MGEATPFYWEQLSLRRRFKKSQQSGEDRIDRHAADEAATCIQNRDAERINELSDRPQWCGKGKLPRAKRGFLELAASQQVALFIDVKLRSKNLPKRTLQVGKSLTNVKLVAWNWFLLKNELYRLNL